MKEKTSMKELLNERLSEEDIIKLVSNYDNKFNELEKENKEKDKEIERLNYIINELEKELYRDVNLYGYEIGYKKNVSKQLLDKLQEIKKERRVI